MKFRKFRQISWLVKMAICSLLLIVPLSVSLPDLPIGVAQQEIGTSSLIVKKSLQPDLIYVKDSIQPPIQAKLAIRVKSTVKKKTPIDLVLVVDRSIPLEIYNQLQQMIVQFIGNFEGSNTHLGLISLSPASVFCPLTADIEFSKAIAKSLLTPTQLRPHIGEAMNLANQELLTKGRSKAIKLMLIISSSAETNLQAMLHQARIASENGVLISTLGIGNFNLPLLRKPTRETGGQHISCEKAECVEQTLQNIFQDLSKYIRGVVASELSATLNLSPGFNLESKLEDCKIHSDQDGIAVRCNKRELTIGEEWNLNLVLSSNKKGLDIPLYKENSKIQFKDQRGIRKVISIDSPTIDIPNLPPKAGFAYTPKKPSNLHQIQFEDQSMDPDGEIIKYEWSFGDGITCPPDCGEGNQKQPTHQYTNTGRFTASLKVSDTPGEMIKGSTSRVEHSIQIFPAATASRKILPFLCNPNRVLLGESFHTKITVAAHYDFEKIVLEESPPVNWPIISQTAEETTFEVLNPNQNQYKWILNKPLKTGDSWEITSEIRVPEEERLESYEFTGTLAGISPEVKFAMSGDQAIQVINKIPIEVAVAYYNTETDELDTSLSPYIEKSQVDQAKEWWAKDTPVPGTQGQTLSKKKMLEIIAYWKKQIPVNDCEF